MKVEAYKSLLKNNKWFQKFISDPLIEKITSLL